jgi:hypothetical protein
LLLSVLRGKRRRRRRRRKNRRGHAFIYREGVDSIEPQLIGDRVDRLYMLRGQPSGYDSTSDEEKKAPETVVIPRIRSFIPREERESLMSTDMRLSWCHRTDAHGGVDSPRSSRFKVASEYIPR